MPNHMTHRMRVFGDAQRLRDFVSKYIKTHEEGKQDENQYLDFDLIVPMPKQIRDDRTDSRGEMGYQVWYGKDWRKVLKFQWVDSEGIATKKALQKFLEKKDPEYKKQADQVKDNIEKHGAPNAYYWAIKNWGTKWNSYDLWFKHEVGPRDWGVTEVEFTFLTAWSPPEPVLQKLSELEPDLRFEVVGFEGGNGFSCKGSFEAGVGSYACGDATPERYEEVFGEKPPQEESDEGEGQG